MRLLLLIMLCSARAFAACPNLAGNYSCVDANGSQGPWSISQSVQNNMTVYTITGMTLITDGQPHTFSTPDFHNGQSVAFCNQNSQVSAQVDGDSYYNNGILGHLSEDVTISQSGTTVTVSIDGVFTNSQGRNRILETENCTFTGP